MVDPFELELMREAKEKFGDGSKAMYKKDIWATTSEDEDDDKTSKKNKKKAMRKAKKDSTKRKKDASATTAVNSDQNGGVENNDNKAENTGVEKSSGSNKFKKWQNLNFGSCRKFRNSQKTVWNLLFGNGWPC